jgi:hypothetical protein
LGPPATRGRAPWFERHWCVGCNHRRRPTGSTPDGPILQSGSAVRTVCTGWSAVPAQGVASLDPADSPGADVEALGSLHKPADVPILTETAGWSFRRELLVGAPRRHPVVSAGHVQRDRSSQQTGLAQSRRAALATCATATGLTSYAARCAHIAAMKAGGNSQWERRSSGTTSRQLA